MFKIRGLRDGKKTLCLVCQVVPRSSQICKEVAKALLWKGTGMIIFFWMNAQYIYFFSSLNYTNIVWELNWILRTR